MQTGFSQVDGPRASGQSLGSVYGVALNHRQQLANVTSTLMAAPYLKPPQSAVLYIKTQNTYLVGGGQVDVPAQRFVQLNATLALKIGRTASRVAKADAFTVIEGYAAALDISEPEEGWFRPDVRLRCQDGFLPLASTFTLPSVVGSTDDLEVTLELDGIVLSQWSTRDLVRPVACLIAEITDYMTLDAGDLLLVGLGPDRVLGKPGQMAKARVARVGEVTCALVASSPS